MKAHSTIAGAARADDGAAVPGPRKRGRRKLAGLAAARRKQMLAAALDLFGTKGFHRTTTQDLADKANVSVGLMYQYFKDKEDLLAAAISQIFDAYLTEIPLAVARESDPLSRFKAAVRAYCRVIDEHREAALLGYRETRSLSRTLTKTLMAKETQSTALVGDRVAECIAAGVFRPVNATVLTYHIVVFVHSWALNSWRLKGEFEREEYVDVGLDMLLGPVLAEPPAAAAGGATKSKATPKPKPKAKPKAAPRRAAVRR